MDQADEGRTPADREGAVTARDGSGTNGLDALGAELERAYQGLIAAGIIAPGPMPRRKRGYSPWCENRECRNFVVPRGGEHPTWLDGRRKDAAFCSAACRQKVYRRRQKREREEWEAIIVQWRPVLIETWGPRMLKDEGLDMSIIPETNWKYWRVMITSALEAIESAKAETR